MLRLQTLGGAVVVDDADDAGAPLAAQRRTLALVAVLAIGGDGLTRDKLVGLFWPEAESERARHALTQALYAARRSFRCDDLFVAGADVRLNDARITSDVRDFERALDAGDLERAAGLYRGPFLDGFYLSGSPDFERWTASQRARLEARMAEALERLASAAAERAELRRAVDWWRQLAALRPLDSGVAVRLMEALAAAGDRASALQHARIHEALLREQLEIEPDRAVTELAERLREPPPTASLPRASEDADVVVSDAVAVLAEPGGEPEEAGRDDVTQTHTSLQARTGRGFLTDETEAIGVWIPLSRRARRRAALTAIVAVAAIAGVGVLIGRERRPAPPAVVPLPLRQQVVVAPFRVSGASSSLEYLREGVVELLSTRLADDSAARSVDAGAVLGAWRAAGLTAATEVPRDTVVRLAARLGAERVVVGSVVGTPARLILRASALRAPAGTMLGEATAEGPADSLTVLIDRLAARLLVSQAGEEAQLADRTTESLPALRAYLAGQAAFRRSRYGAAVRNYEAAIARDSMFALAALGLAVAADRAGDLEWSQRGLSLAWRGREALGERDLALLTALTGPAYPAPSPAAEQLAAWQRVVDLAPSRAEAWFTLGARLFHDGAVAGVPAARERARAALERALTLDTNYAPAGQLLLQLATGNEGSAPPASGDLGVALRDSVSPFAPFLRWRLATVDANATAPDSAWKGLARFDAANLRAVALASQYDAMGLTDGAHALKLLQSRRASSASRVDLLLAEHSLALNQGHVRQALDATARLGRLQPGSRAYLRLRVLDALYGDGDGTAAAAAARALHDLTGSAPTAAIGTTPGAWAADVCVLAQWRLARGDTAGARRTADDLRKREVASQALPISAGSAACAELLDANLAVVTRRPDALARVAGLDSLALTPQTLGDAAAYAPLLVARLHERLGDAHGALRAIRRRTFMTGWPRYLAATLREEGRLAEIAGDRAGAREAYRRFLALRADPDPALLPQADDVRRRALALSQAASRP